jgi:hypothetical protein
MVSYVLLLSWLQLLLPLLLHSLSSLVVVVVGFRFDDSIVVVVAVVVVAAAAAAAAVGMGVGVVVGAGAASHARRWCTHRFVARGLAQFRRGWRRFSKRPFRFPGNCPTTTNTFCRTAVSSRCSSSKGW